MEEEESMKQRVVLSLAIGVAVLGLASSALAQAPKRQMVAVMDFDFGTVHEHWWGDYDIGKGMADQVVDALVNDGSFRVIERKKLDTVLAEQDFARSDRADPSAAKLAKIGKVLGIKYVITGSITKFGGEQKGQGASFKGIGVGLGKAKTEVAITARMVDMTTGEILVSAKGLGVSKKGGGFSFSKGGTSVGQNTTDFHNSAIGEAQEMACNELVKQLVAKKDRLE
jgi:curli biogenesis system outer membrane secretion channel CsgG